MNKVLSVPIPNSKFLINQKIFLENIIIYLAIFPWVSFGLNRMDSQPWVLIFLIIYFLFTRKIYKINIFFFWVFTIITIILVNMFYIFSDIMSPGKFAQFFLLIRSISSYSIIILLWFFSIQIHKSRNPIFHYIIGSWIYVIYGLLQSYGYDFLDWMSYDRSSQERGVTSFAPEPTHLGMILFFLSWIIYNSVNKKDGKKTLLLAHCTIIFNILSIFFLAKSAMAILWIIIAISVFSVRLIFSFKYLLYISAVIMIIVSIFYFNYEFFHASRAVQIALTFYRLGIMDYLIQDWSFNSRASAIVLPIMGVIENSGLPGGITSYPDVAMIINQKLNNLFFTLTASPKILSFNCTIIYEFGALAIFIYIFSFFILRKEANWSNLEIILLFILLFSGVPMGTGLVGLLLGSKLITDESFTNGK